MENHTSTLAPLFEHAGYRLLKPLGQGGMGQVYLAEDIQLARQVAVKLVASRGNAEQGLQEARMLARLNHANIVQIHSVFELEQQLAIVMEYVPGQTLFEYQYSHMANMTQKLGLLCQIAEGLAAAHQQGIIHCDLKPANILLDHQQQVKITDFGIARLSHHTSAASFTYGSQAYMSPEQLMDKALDYCSDLFSFGILAFHLLSGWHPFGTGDNQQLAKRIVEGEAMCAHKNIPGVPEALAELLNQLLAALPAKRPSDTQELAQRLRAIHNTMVNDDIISQATLVHKPQRKPVLQRPWFKRAALSLTALSLIAALGVAGYQIFKPEPKMLVVLEPELTTTDQAFLPQAQLVAATVDDALRQSVINSDNMRLIPRSEAKGIEGIKNIALATGATDIIQSSLHCNQVKCDISLSQISGKDYTVQKQKQWPVISDELYEVYNSTIEQSFFVIQNQHRNLGNSSCDNKCLLTFYEMYYSFYFNNGASKDVFQSLLSLKEEMKGNYSYLSLFRRVSLDLFYSTNDYRYLRELKSIVDGDFDFLNSYQGIVYSVSIAIAEGDKAKAYSLMSNLKSLERGEYEGMEIEGYAAFMFSDYAKSILLYERALKYRDGALTRYNLALSYWHLGELDKAKSILRKSLFNYGHRADFLQLLALIDLSLGNIKDSLSYYELLLPDKISDIDVDNLVVAYILDGDYTSAYKYSSYAYQRTPDHIVSMLNYGDVIRISNRPGSIKIYNSLIDKFKGTEEPSHWGYLAQAYAQLGNAKKALRFIKKAERTNSSSSEYLMSAAIVYLLVKEENSAIFYIEEAVQQGISPTWFNLPWFKPLCGKVSMLKNLSICTKLEVSAVPLSLQDPVNNKP